MQKTINVGLNVRADGSVVLDGDHAPGTSDGTPWPLAGVAVERSGVGSYRVTGPGIAWPDGWRTSIYRDDNDALTIRVALGRDETGLTVACTDPSTGEPKDIIYLLTLRVAVTIDVPEPAAIEAMASLMAMPEAIS